jgi:hypothetical protein
MLCEICGSIERDAHGAELIERSVGAGRHAGNEATGGK